MSMKRVLVLSCFALVLSAVAVLADNGSDGPAAPAVDPAALEAACALLDDAQARSRMDGLLLKLAIQCERPDLLGEVEQEHDEGPNHLLGGGTDVQVNDPTGDTGTARTQNETSLAHNATTGTICSGFNDSWSGVTGGQGYTGYSRSTDGGATFVDQGALGSRSFGDPAMVWRQSDGFFYFAALDSDGLGMWRSTDDCDTFTFLSNPHVGAGDDKELLAVDNNPANTHYGRLYVAWTNFTSDRIEVTHSDDGTTWSTPVAVSQAGSDVQGAWPVVAPNGDVFVTWVRWNPYPTGPIDVEVVRSTNGGDSFSFVAEPLTGGVNPTNAAATTFCGRPALKGNIRYLPSPQLVVGPDGALHVVYVRGGAGGDAIDAYYRRSTDSGATWSSEMKLHDDATTNDQFFPAISISSTNVVTAGWYDRREDVDNLRVNYYTRQSFDGGVTWGANVKVSDVDSPVALDSNLATCYHGDYDTHVSTETAALVQFADDRSNLGGSNNADTYVESVPLSTDFLVTNATGHRSICTPADAVYDLDVQQFLGFNEPVTLGAAGQPAGTTAGFAPNPVLPGNSTALTVGNTVAAAAGSYVITVTGTSSPSSFVHDVDLGLDVFTAVAGGVTLTAPTDGATNQPLRPTFTWTAAAQAEEYLLEIDDTASFTSLVYSATVTETSHTPTADLPSNTPLYWRVRASNPCGDGAQSSTFDLLTIPLPGDCPLGLSTVEAYSYGFEAGAGGWTGSGTGNTWAQSSARVHGGSFAWLAVDPATVSDQRLTSPAIAVPDDPNVTLQFWNHQTIEHRSAGGCYDGGILEISTNGGATFTQVTAGLQTDPYDGAVNDCCSNPLVGLDAWCGDPQDWTESIVDLSPWAGQTIHLRFRLASDTVVAREGWYLDDIVIQTCSNGEVFDDGFESGDTTAWTATTP